MAQLLGWIAILYLALKATQWATRPASGYADATPSIVARLRRGEPWLVLGAIALPAFFFFYSSWWVDRWAARGFAHATDCIGQLSSLDRLPGIYARFRRADISDSALGYYELALDQGGRRGIGFDRIVRVIEGHKGAYAVRYAGLAQSGASAAIDAQFDSIDRCLKDEWPHDGLLNP